MITFLNSATELHLQLQQRALCKAHTHVIKIATLLGVVVKHLPHYNSSLFSDRSTCPRWAHRSDSSGSQHALQSYAFHLQN